MGSKARYDFTDKDLLINIEGLIRDGWDNQQVAKYLGYNITYFSELITKHPELSEAITRGRKPLTFNVENSLYKRSVGMKVKSVTRRWLVGPDGKQTDVEIIQETETDIPPDPKAIDLWLRSKKPEIWNKQPDKHEVNLKGSISIDEWIKDKLSPSK